MNTNNRPEFAKSMRCLKEKSLAGAVFRCLLAAFLGCLALTLLPSCAIQSRNDPSPLDSEYQNHLEKGWQYYNRREHRKALVEFSEAGSLKPGLSEPISGRARALFAMARFPETLESCAKISNNGADGFGALGFCWGARLEIGRAEPEIEGQVEREIESLLENPDPSPELLYSIYKGYYYLKDRKNARQMILRLAEMDLDPDMARDIADALFEEIISAKPGTETRIELARSYVGHFPDGKMADKAALVVLGNSQGNEDADPLLTVKNFQKNHLDTLPIREAAAFWLIDHETGYDYAAALMEQNLQEIENRLTGVPPRFTELLWRQEIDTKRAFYRYLLGRAWLGMDRVDKSTSLFDEVLKTRQDWPGVYHFRGMAALHLGQIDQAVDYLQQALAKGSVRPETEEYLHDLLSKHYGFVGKPLAYFQRRESNIRFTDVTAAAGLAGIKAMRVAWGDYDNDGDDDLLLDGLKLYTNGGESGFVKNNELIPSGLGAASGGIFGDYDNDGFLDIFAYSRQGNILLHNDSGKRFRRVAGLPIANIYENPEAAAWGELNNDGFLDLYIANYEYGTVMRGQCGRDRLLVNQRGVIFRDVTETEGAVSDENMCGRGVTWSDLNGDGRQDIIVANYRLDPNFFWLNHGDGHMEDIAGSAGVRGHEVEGAFGHSIGSVAGDLDNDLDPDLFISNLAHPRYIEFSDQDMVLINSGGRMPEFVDRYPQSGISFDETNADPLFFDVDNDGDLDLFITSVYPNRTSHLYLNDGHGRFIDRTWLSEAGIDNGWGAAATDYDNDGFLDLVVASPDGIHLLHNEDGGNNWLALKIDDRDCNRFGVGGKVIVKYNGQRQIREVTAGRGTGSQDSMTVHFGLGRYKGPVQVSLQTLCGDHVDFTVEKPNQLLTIDNPQPH